MVVDLEYTLVDTDEFFHDIIDMTTNNLRIIINCYIKTNDEKNTCERNTWNVSYSFHMTLISSLMSPTPWNLFLFNQETSYEDVTYNLFTLSNLLNSILLTLKIKEVKNIWGYFEP